MITGLNKDAIEKYVLEKEKDSKNPTVFHLGTVQYMDRIKMIEVYSSEDKSISSIAELNKYIINKYVVKVENIFINGESRTIENDIIDHLNLDDITELMNKLTSINKLSPEEEKN